MSPSASAPVTATERLIVVGWLIMHRLNRTDEEAVLQARTRMLAFLREQFAQ